MLFKKSYVIATSLLLIVPVLIAAVKFFNKNFELQDIVPREVYTVTLELDMADLPQSAFVKTYLPQSDYRQNIRNFSSSGDSLVLNIDENAHGLQARWDINNHQDVFHAYSYEVEGKYVQFDLPEHAPFDVDFDPEIQVQLMPERYIQTSHPSIVMVADSLKTESVLTTLKSNFAFVQAIENSNTRLLTDAESALRLQRASCNGKSRLFTAICRAQGIPSRVIGGTILENTQKRTSHLWSEIYYGGEWIPFDVTNNHFASLPANYLQLYTGDSYLFSHTKDLKFDYQFNIQKKYQSISEAKVDAPGLWPLLIQLHLPMNLLRTILLLPLAALLISIFRNVIGIKTFGILLPALIGLALVNVDLKTGLLAFGIVIIIVSILHKILEHWTLLHVPKVAIILTAVILSLIFMGLLGILLGWEMGAMMMYLPIVIISITAERFAKVLHDESSKEAMKMLGNTAFIALMTCILFRSKVLIGVFLTFPELYISLIVVMMLLGKWIGMRLTEYRRFSPAVS